MRYVIIGNSAAAAGAVEGIRQIDTNGDITIISSEPYHIYSRPLISYYLAGKTDKQRIKYRPDDFYQKNKCQVLFGRRAIKISSDDKNVLLDDGSLLGYDKLLVSTGSVSFIPPFKGLETVKNKHTFLSWDDALAIEKKITKDTRVLIIGAGLIGLKCAEGIVKQVKSVTVVDLCPNILSSILDEQASKTVQEHLENNGISFVLGKTADRFESNTAFLSDLSTVEFDLLVLAVGVLPNVSLIKDIGGAVNRGVLTDTLMQTSIKDIYAAGDCTESMDITSGQSKVLALLPNAYKQGECAGINMAGGRKEYNNAIPMNAIGFFGMHILTAGSYAGEVYSDICDGCIKKLFFKDNVLKGFILINKTQNAGIYTSLIANSTPLDTIDFGLICERPSLVAFTRDYRNQILGGVV